MRIVADENIPAVEQFFGRFGDIQTHPGRTLRPEQVKDADVLLVRSVTKVDEALLSGSSVKFVGTCTIGMDHLDTAYLDSCNISYANAPGCNAEGVVQYDLAALGVIDSQWQNKRVGVIGCGNVGGRLLKALASLNVECLAYDPLLSKKDHVHLTDLDSVLDCDIICMHAPYTVDGPHPTHHMINEQALKRIRPGAILLNAGRGGAIDNLALLNYLKKGADLTVVLDVWEHEPDINIELLPYVKIATSHIAGYGFEGKLNGSSMIFDALTAFLVRQEGANESIDPTVCERYGRELLTSLKGESSVIRCNSVNEAIASTYNIVDDDVRFRVAIEAAALEQSKLGSLPGRVTAAFDGLRKTYPTRRELNHFKIVSSDMSLKQSLRKIGFCIDV